MSATITKKIYVKLFRLVTQVPKRIAGVFHFMSRPETIERFTFCSSEAYNEKIRVCFTVALYQLFQLPGITGVVKYVIPGEIISEVLSLFDLTA